MNEEENEQLLIPSVFYSFDTKRQFERCIECDRYLLDGSTEYFIEKAIKNYDGFTATDVIFEYALCLPCAERLRQKMSKESFRKLESYFAQNIDFNKRMSLMQNHPYEPEFWLNECMISGKKRGELKEYQLFAHCKGNHLVMSQMPYVISGETLEALSDLLSDETLDELDDFSRRHFGPPPELQEDLPIRRVVMI